MLKKLLKTSHKLSPGLRKIISNMGWLSVEKVLSMVVSLTIGVYVIRYLGSDSFGLFSYCLSLVGMFEAIAKLGLDAIVVRALVNQEESTPDILGTALILKLLGSLVTLGLIAVTIYTLNYDPQVRWITMVMALTLIFRPTEVIDFWFSAKVLSRSIAIVRSLKLLVGSVVKIGFILLGFPLAAFVWLLLAEEVFRTVTTVWIYWRHNRLTIDKNILSAVGTHRLSSLRWKFNFAQAKVMMRDSWPLILSGVMITIYMKIDQVMLGNMSSNDAVGNYAAAVKFSEVWYFFPLAVCTSVFPTILRAKQRSRREYYQKLQQLYDALAWVSLLIAIVMTFCSSILVNALLGEGYIPAGQILALHVWAGPFVFLGVARSQWLMAENLTGLSFACTFLGTVVNLILNYWLIPLYAGRGAAIATIISYAVSSHLTCIIYPKMNDTGWMLTKALFIPVRIRQNLTYLSYIKKGFD